MLTGNTLEIGNLRLRDMLMNFTKVVWRRILKRVSVSGEWEAGDRMWNMALLALSSFFRANGWFFNGYTMRDRGKAKEAAVEAAGHIL